MLEMKVLKQILFAIAVMICFSITASAQKQDDKKPPKNQETPKIKVVPKEGEKPKGNEKPKDDKKKPQSAYFKSTDKEEMILV